MYGNRTIIWVIPTSQRSRLSNRPSIWLSPTVHRLRSDNGRIIWPIPVHGSILRCGIWTGLSQDKHEIVPIQWSYPSTPPCPFPPSTCAGGTVSGTRRGTATKMYDGGVLERLCLENNENTLTELNQKSIDQMIPYLPEQAVSKFLDARAKFARYRARVYFGHNVRQPLRIFLWESFVLESIIDPIIVKWIWFSFASLCIKRTKKYAWVQSNMSRDM